jgi:NADPH:quinone reductase-like Zn-dependent oxidoreductase
MTPSSIVHEANENQSPSSMMAWRVHEFGPPDVMRFEQVPRPSPGGGEVLVKVEAVGVGPWDGWIRAGKSALPQPLPLTLGSDLSGEIVAVGPGVSDLRVGDQVSCGRPGLWCYESPVHRSLCRVCFGFGFDGCEKASLADLH